MAPAERRAVATFLLGIVGLPAAMVAAGTAALYMAGNGIVPGAVALSTLPVLTVAPAILAWGRWRRAALVLTAGLLAFDIAFSVVRVSAVAPDRPIALWSDGTPATSVPWMAALIREDETAYAGIAVTRALGVLSSQEAAEARPAFQAKLDAIPGGPGANALLLESRPDHVYSLVWLPPGDGPVPAIVFLHGYGGLLTAYVSALLESPALARYAIIAPAESRDGAWWTEDAHAIVTNTLDHLSSRVDRDRVYLVGLSNGAIGATTVAADERLAPRFRAAVTVVGLGDLEDGVPRIPLETIAGIDDPRFPIEFIDDQVNRLVAAGGDVQIRRFPFDHFGLFTDTAEVDAAIADYLATH
jgi:dienelactone hydrolase